MACILATMSARYVAIASPSGRLRERARVRERERASERSGVGESLSFSLSRVCRGGALSLLSVSRSVGRSVENFDEGALGEGVQEVHAVVEQPDAEDARGSLVPREERDVCVSETVVAPHV